MIFLSLTHFLVSLTVAAPYGLVEGRAHQKGNATSNVVPGFVEQLGPSRANWKADGMDCQVMLEKQVALTS